MQSKFISLKEKAIKLRRRGYSIGLVEQKLGIPRSTLSGWFKSVPLTNVQKVTLFQNWQRGLMKARQKAVIWHNEQKSNRLKVAKESALISLIKIKRSPEVLELALAMLYFGEGAKSDKATAMGNSDPLYCAFSFIYCLIFIKYR